MAQRDVVESITRITSNADYASQLSAIITELGISIEDSKKYFKTIDTDILTTDLTFITALSEIARYEGFNPREMIKKLIGIHSKTEREIRADPNTLESIRTTLSINDHDVEFEFTNNMPFHSDIQFICLMFITRGAAFDKILKKSNKVMAECMTMIRLKYNINVGKRKPGQSLEASIVTIPRIAASFPGVTVGLFHKGFGRCIFDPQLIFQEAVIPRAMLSPMVVSVLPKTQDTPIAVFLAIAVKTDDILHQMEPTKTSLNAIYQYFMASYNSTAVTEMLKMKYCESWGLGSRTNGMFIYNVSIVALQTKSKDFIRSSRPNDPDLNTILSTI